MARPKAPQRKPATASAGGRAGKRMESGRLSGGWPWGLGEWVVGGGPIVRTPSPPLGARRHFPELGWGMGARRGEAAGSRNRRGDGSPSVFPKGADRGSGVWAAERFRWPPGPRSESAEPPLPLPPGNRIWRPPFSRLLPRCDICVLHFSGFPICSLLPPPSTGSLFLFSARFNLVSRWISRILSF